MLGKNKIERARCGQDIEFMSRCRICKKEKGFCKSSFTKYDDSCEYLSCDNCIKEYFENLAKESEE